MLCAAFEVTPSACWETCSRLNSKWRECIESIRKDGRARIREERNNNTQGTQTLVNRTCNLIRGSASFAARSLSASPFASRSVQPLPQSQNSQSSDKGKRLLPGHPYRLGSKKSETATPESIPKTVYLLDEPDFEDGEEYSLTDSTRPFVPPAVLRYIWNALVQPHFNYCNEVWGIFFKRRQWSRH